MRTSGAVLVGARRDRGRLCDERGLDGLDRDERRVDPLGALEGQLERVAARGRRCVERAADAGLELARVQVGADRDPLPPAPACARPPVSASKNSLTSAGVRAIGPTWSSERASGKTPVAGMRL